MAERDSARKRESRGVHYVVHRLHEQTAEVFGDTCSHTGTPSKDSSCLLAIAMIALSHTETHKQEPIMTFAQCQARYDAMSDDRDEELTDEEIEARDQAAQDRAQDVKDNWY